jgi:hypothetical protein
MPFNTDLAERPKPTAKVLNNNYSIGQEQGLGSFPKTI